MTNRTPGTGYLSEAHAASLYAPTDAGQLPAAKRNALKPFRTAVANRNNAPCDIAYIGHSFIDAIPTTSYLNKFSNRTTEALRQRRPTSAAGGYGYLTRTQSGTFADDPISIAGPTISTQNGYGYGRKAWFLSSTGDKVTYTNVTCSDFDLFYHQSNGNGTLYYKLDGGAATTFSTSAPTTDPGHRLSITGLTPGPHTIEVGWSSGALAVFNGIAFYNGDAAKGIRAWNGGYNGSTSAWWVDPANQTWLATLATVQPDLVVLCDMTNDWYSGNPLASAAQSKANNQLLIANIRAVCATSPSFVISAEYQRGDGSGAEPWADYVQAVYDLAAADTGGPDGGCGVAVYEMGKRFGPGPFAGATALISPDKIHPTTAGAQFWADDFAEWLLAA